ncbi:glycosyltransferase family 2 protein [Rhodoflexus caldus]|uniref:glycosyltransferase family 2 protein n=1 Tax=Rhodoflexus caldus TaxID=2891236 RepID=UPI00202A8ED9|nr:glycosyltransferase family 2 protein [Rhodoflexus caldus]
MQAPKISIVTPTFNAAATIAACIESVASQTYANKEHWIIDGLSTDNTMDIVQQYAAVYPHIRYISEKDQGIYDAMNKGIQLSEGEWLYFLGADDTFYSENVLQDIFYCKKINKNTGILYGNVFIGNSYFTNYSKQYNHSTILFENLLHQSYFTARSLFDKLGLFNIKYRLSSEIEFNIRAMASNTNFEFVDVIICKFAYGGQSGHVNNRHLLVKERLEILLQGINQLKLHDFTRKKAIIFTTKLFLREVLLNAFPISFFRKQKYRYTIGNNIIIKVATKRWLLKEFVTDDGVFTNIHKGSIAIAVVQILFLLYKRPKKLGFYLINSCFWLKMRLKSNA